MSIFTMRPPSAGALRVFGVRQVGVIMSIVTFMTSAAPASAGMVETQRTIEAAGSVAGAVQQRERLLALLQRQDIRAEMVRLGVDPAEAGPRIAALSDAEVRELAGHLDRLPAGAGFEGAVIIIFIVFGLLVILDAIGAFNVFNFVCGPGECAPAPPAARAPAPAAGPDYYYQEPLRQEPLRPERRQPAEPYYDGEPQDRYGRVPRYGEDLPQERDYLRERSGDRQYR